MNETVQKNVINCTEDTNWNSSFSRLALVLQAVILNLTLNQVEGREYAGSLLNAKYWDETHIPIRSYYPSRDYYPDQPLYQNIDRYNNGGRYAGYDSAAAYEGLYGKGTGGERAWSQGRHGARRRGQVSSGFSNSYSKNEKGDSTVYYHDGLARSADLAYNDLSLRFRDNGGGHERSQYSSQGGYSQHYPDRPYWYSQPQYSYPRFSRFHIPTKKTSLYAVPSPRTYYIDKPSI